MKERKKTGLFRVLLLCLSLGALLAAPSCGGGAGSSGSGSSSNDNIINTGAYNTPWGMAANSSGSRLFVANNVSNQVTVYNTADMSIMKQIDVVCTPRYLTLNGDESKLYITHDEMKAIEEDSCAQSKTSYDVLQNGVITIVDVATLTVNKEIEINTNYSVSSARDIIYDSDHDVIYILGTNSVAIMDPATDKIIGNVTNLTNGRNARIRYDSDNGFIYVLHYGGVDNGTSQYLVDVIIPDDPKSLSFSRAGYNNQANGHCLCDNYAYLNEGKACEASGQTTNCFCYSDSNCLSGDCVGGSDSSESFPIPYCDSVDCDTFTAVPEYSTGTTKIPCEVTTTADSCISYTYVVSNSCAAYMQINPCYNEVTSETVCTADSTCQAGYSCNSFYQNCATPRACVSQSECKIGFACKDGFCVAANGIDCTPGDDSDCTEIHTCNTTTGKCQTVCESNYDCEGDNYYCDCEKDGNDCLPATSGYCKKKIYSDDLCEPEVDCIYEDGVLVCSYAYPECNEESGWCEYYSGLNELCVEDGYVCGVFSDAPDDYVCVNITSYFNECPTEGYTCNQQTGLCEMTEVTDSVCKTSNGYSCELYTDPESEESDYYCIQKQYYNGCDCDTNYNCYGDNAACSASAGCYTYVKMQLDNVAGYCDRDTGECYYSTSATELWEPLKDLDKCTHPADFLVLPDGTAYVTCYGDTDGDEEEDADPVLRIMWDEDGLARNGSVMATRDSFIECNKPTKLALSPDGSLVFMICFDSNQLYTIDVDSGDIIDIKYTPQDPVAIITTSDYIYVTGSTSQEIARFPMPAAVNTDLVRTAPATRLSDYFMHVPLEPY